MGAHRHHRGVHHAQHSRSRAAIGENPGALSPARARHRDHRRAVRAAAHGFAAAVLSGFVLAVGISYSRAVRDLTYPFLVTAQVLPKVAFAPLFLIWFGFGLTPKVVIAALIAFFPIVINTAKGLSSVEA